MLFSKGVSFKVEVRKVSNGWIVEWEENSDAIRKYNQSLVQFPRDPAETSGTILYTNKKDLMKFLQERL